MEQAPEITKAALRRLLAVCGVLAFTVIPDSGRGWCRWRGRNTLLK